MKRIFSSSLYIFVCLNFLSLTGCLSSDEYNVSKYTKTFDRVKTHMYQWSQVHGGIYWINDTNIVLEAYIKGESGSLDRGLYQVNVNDGRAEKIVDIPETGGPLFKYCFDGKVLNVMVKNGEFNQVSQPKNYSVAIRDQGKKKRTNRYSKLRCSFVELPQIERTAYLPLRAEDGLIKNDATNDDGQIRAFLVNDDGKHLKQISDKRLDRGIRAYVPYLDSYVPHLETYFGKTAFKNDCTFITHLYRDSWQLTHEELCIKNWAFGSRLISRLNDAYYLEHHTSKEGEPKHYVFFKDLRIPLGTTSVLGSSVSPDGCIVAYGSGDRGVGKKIPRQELGIFNYCEFFEKELEI